MTPRFTLTRRLAPDHAARSLRADVSAGLTATPKTLPPKWFYDARGSDLFEEITRLPEYYPTRTEREILTAAAPAIAQLTGARTLVELGSGSSEKTRLLLDALGANLRGYAPLDVSESALREAGEALVRDYPDLEVAATVADFESPIVLPDTPGPYLLAFLGSTLGNLDAGQRAAFLTSVRTALGPGDALLLGADLVKDTGELLRAYDDSSGVTAAFNKNVLHVLNRELQADFDPDAFDHRAVWDPAEERVEMRLRSAHEQQVKIAALDLLLHFEEGEEWRTEISVKFRRESLAAELAAAGLAVRQWWTDEHERFALLLAEPV
ncbi:L-histidine N(alpha)-methyltransferase [Streptomyces polyrhachis]|uniref:Histidine N-alpha-methyltransferase n=1 Tax=Streptomyces polyrhachis TaxID=1282885 RepID=A0ABW2GDG8_9ACTN